MQQSFNKYGFSKPAAFILLMIVAAPLFFLMFSQLRLQVIKWEMKERMEASLLQTICINTKDIVWVEKNKEIRQNDRLFDIKSSREEGDRTFFTGLYDDEETLLQKKVDDLTGNQPSFLFSLARVLSLFVNVLQGEENVDLPVYFISDKSFSFITPSVCSVTLKVPTPPPLL